jgi:hypothetical protein
VGTYALVDNGASTTVGRDVVVVGPPGEGVMAKDEAKVAAAVGGSTVPAGPQVRTDTDAPTSSLSGTPGFGSREVEINPSTGYATPHEPTTRYDGGPQEGTRGPGANTN